MGKKESPDKEISNSGSRGGGASSKLSVFTGRIFGIIKFILGICLLPFVYSTTIVFLSECGVLEKTINQYFFAGAIAFLIIYLFIYEPVKLYNKGQKILEAVFRFFTPLVKVAPYLLPIYTIILLFIYFLYSLINKSPDAVRYFILLFGFTIALHLVFSAKSLRSRQGDFLKANYIFGFSFLYIINLAILAFAFNLIFKPYSFVNFCNQSFQVAKTIFSSIFKQLFLR